MAKRPGPPANGYAQSGCRWYPRREAAELSHEFPAQLELTTKRFGMPFRLFSLYAFARPESEQYRSHPRLYALKSVL